MGPECKSQVVVIRAPGGGRRKLCYLNLFTCVFEERRGGGDGGSRILLTAILDAQPCLF